MWGKKPVTAVVFVIGGVISQDRQESFFRLGAMLFGCTPEALSSEAVALVPRLETGEWDSHQFWCELGLALERAGTGRRQDPEKFKGLWLNLLKDSLRLDRSMLYLCRKLKQRVPIAALSNTISEHARYLEAYGAYQIFDPCLLSCDLGVRKPDKAIYQMTAKALGVKPRNCLFIDDSRTNIEGAKAAKMQVHHFVDQPTLEAALRELNLLG